MTRTLLILLGVLTVTAVGRADPIDRAMVEQADAIYDAVKSLKAKNVAVLKFDYIVGEKSSFTAGTINTLMANRLSNVLVLKYGNGNRLLVLADAGAAAAKTSAQKKQEFTWRTPEGRAEFAAIEKLPLVWDADQQLPPDGFVTGEVAVSPDYKTTTVTFFGFTKADPSNLRKLYTLAAPKSSAAAVALKTDRGMLQSFGQGFNLVAARGRGATDTDTAAAEDAAARDRSNAAPASGTEEGVRLRILVDGREAPWETNGGEARIPVSPKAGQKLTFWLKNTSTTDTFAVVLAVNGRNTNAQDNDTLYDKLPHDQRKWVLPPNYEFALDGFQTQANEKQPFVIAAEDESTAIFSQMNMHEYQGKISLIVFGKTSSQSANKPLEAAPLSADLTIGSRGIGDLKTVAPFQKKLRKAANVDSTDGKLTTTSRGIIKAGLDVLKTDQIEKLEFEYDPQPVSSLDIRYYVPRTGK
jgi:hypothetical protein